MVYKELLSAVAIVLTFVAFFPYIRAIINGAIKPHVFSWIIWGMTTFVVFLAQLEDNGGAGAWPIGVSGAITIFIALLAYLKRADTAITRTDWLFFVAAVSSLPFWYFTSDPLWAVVILTTVDVLGFGPTSGKHVFFRIQNQCCFLLSLRLAISSLLWRLRITRLQQYCFLPSTSRSGPDWLHNLACTPSR